MLSERRPALRRLPGQNDGVTLTRAQRIDMITQSATLLDSMEWARLDLILTEHGFRTWRDWEEDSQLDYITRVVKEGADDNLEELHSYLLSRDEGTVVTASPFNSAKVRLFLSHLSIHLVLVGDVGRALDRFGIDAFIAHDSIEISKQWQQVIEDGLTDCDAMVVFLHDGFEVSAWCDQELGWVMGRKRPVMILGFDRMPHGFAGKFQALPVAAMNATQIGSAVFDWVVSQRTLRPRLAESLSLAFVGSQSYDRTRFLIPLLEQVEAFTDDQLSRIEEAVKSNSQVRDASYNYQPVPTWVANFAAERRSSGTQGWMEPIDTIQPF